MLGNHASIFSSASAEAKPLENRIRMIQGAAPPQGVNV